MRNLLLSVAVLLAVVACGPSGKDVAMAKQARYQGDKLVLFTAVKTATEAKYKLAKSDETTLGMQTAGKWYTQDGMVAAGSDENMQDVPDKAIRVSLVVRLVPDGDKWIVAVEPFMVQRLSGSPQPQKLEANDPSVPGWATGQVDTLQFEIHSALKQYEVKSPGGVAPAPEAAPAPAAAPAADPAAGSGSAEPVAPAPAQ